MRLSIALAVLCGLGFVDHASGQGAPPDTLDWRRYYPLAVGNVWEYHDEEAPGDLFRHSLLSDTLVGGRQYFRRAIHTELRLWNDTVRWVDHDYVRYDTAGAVLSIERPEDDSLVHDPCAEDDSFERSLRLGFGSAEPCPRGSWDSLRVQGEYGATWTPPGGTPIVVAGLKWFVLDHLWSTMFVTDIGPVAAGNLWGPRLHYARIDGVEYGTPEITVATEPSPVATSTLAISPNPVRERAVATITQASGSSVRLSAFDVLGREVAVLHDGPLSAGVTRIPVSASALRAGLYVMRATGDGWIAARTFIVAR